MKIKWMIIISVLFSLVFLQNAFTNPTPPDGNNKIYFLSAQDASIEDAFVYADKRRNLFMSNWGGCPQLFIASRVGGFPDRHRHTFIKFDAEEVSRFPKLLKSVKLQLYDGSGANNHLLKNYQVNAVNVVLYRVIDPWIEGTGGDYKGKYLKTYPDAGKTISWRNQPRYDTTKVWARTHLPRPSKGMWVEWDITELVKAWVSGTYPNHGLVLVGEGEGKQRFIHLFTSTEWPNKKFSPRLKVIKTLL